jgi:hypothetical protein
MRMRRDTFLKSIAAAPPPRARCRCRVGRRANLKMTTRQPGRTAGTRPGRALGKALMDSGAAAVGQLRQQGRRRRLDRPGAVRNRQQGRGRNALMVMGA